MKCANTECGKEIAQPKKSAKRKYCSMSCYRKIEMIRRRQTFNHPWYGRHLERMK